FETYFERWLASGWEAHLRTWWSHRTSPRVLWVRFRDLKEDLPASLRQIAHFLEWQCDDATVQRSAAHASFSWMAAHRTKFTKFSRDDAPSWKPKSFIRAGRVGDHEAALSPSQSSRIRDLANAHLEPACVAFLGLPTT
ncbi:MAG: sulfotransferase domain-containing protein, partial [Myxococcota bacterium]